MTYKEIIKLLKENPTKEKVEEILSNINIKYYIPIQSKIGYASALASSIVEANDLGIYFISPSRQRMIEDFLLFKYTDIEKDTELIIEEYDFLKEVNFYQLLKNKVVNEDYYCSDFDELIELLITYAEQQIEVSKLKNTGAVAIFKTTLDNFMDKIVNTYATENGKKAIKGIIKDIGSNQELLDTVNNLLSQFNLDNYMEELMKRIAETKSEKSKENKKQKNINENKEQKE